MSDEANQPDEHARLDTGTLDSEDLQRRKAEIMRLKRTGATFEAIGRVVGLSRQRVHQIYKATLLEIPFEEVTTYRAEQLARYDALLEKANEVLERRHITVSNGRVVQLPDANGELVPLEDDGPTLDAIRVVLAIENQRADLLGLKTPVKQHVQTDQTITYAFEGIDLGSLT